MSLRDTLNEHMKDAMRAKDKVRLGTIRLIQADIKKADITFKTEGKGEIIDDAAILSTLQKMIKQRQESADIYETNGRPDAAAQERAEIDIINAYLPQMKTEEETKALVEQTISDLGAGTMADMGKVIGALKAKYPGQLDMGMASKLVKAALS